MIKITFFALILVSAVYAENAFTDDAEIQPLRKVSPKKPAETLPELRRKPVRRTKTIASVEDAANKERVRERVYHKYPADYKLGLLGGVSNLNALNASTQAARDQTQITQNFYVGLNLDLNPFRYIGVEAEGFYGLAPTQNSTDFFGNSTTVTLKQYGGMGNLKFLLPFELTNGFVLIPKAGGGYGYYGMQYTSVSNGTTSQVFTNTFGVYGTIGLDIDIAQLIVLSCDYALSIGAQGNYSSAGTTTANVASNYDRLRIGAYLRFLPFMGIGAQYIRRTISSSSPATGFSGEPTGNEIQNQFLGQLVFEF